MLRVVRGVGKNGFEYSHGKHGTIVHQARAEIIGPTVRYLTPDSTLRLICRVVQSTETSEFLFWYQDDRMINYDSDRGVNISTEPDYNYSELTIMRATKQHSGNYSCVPSNAQPASVTVHIFKAFAAMILQCFILLIKFIID
uniref:Uncharacterized protein n=1 Tax=Phlebotomus papatasi TaxID=29031 RepID=A0A1B0D0E0_PHLPP